MQPIQGRQLIDALMKAGIADELTKRVVVDIPANGFPTLYIEKVGSKTLLDIVPAITNAEIVQSCELNTEGEEDERIGE